MKRRGKLFGLALSLVLIVSLVLPAVAYAAGPDRPAKPDKEKPVPATNVELVKKVSVRTPGPPIVPPGRDKKKTKEGAATGILGESVSGSRYAVVVGISDYPGEDNDLNYSDDDAIDMRDALVDVYGFSPDNVTLLLGMQGTQSNPGAWLATRYNILTTIGNIEGAGEVVFFFSGHGVKGNARDWDKERIDEGICVWGEDEEGNQILTYIWDGELQQAFAGTLTLRIIFIFDTCLAGGMKKDLEAPGRIIAMATTEQGTAIESEALQHGEFSYYFVDEGMLQGMADITGTEGVVTVEEAWDYAKANCSYDKPTIGDYFENDLLL